MGWDGNGNVVRTTGVYTGSQVWQNTRDAARAIRADDEDTHDEDLATAIENSVARDGQNAATADLPMGGNIHTGVGSSTARTNYATVAQVQDGDYQELGSVAGTDTITGAAGPTITAYAQGQTFRFVAAGTNTGATTLNLNSLGAKAIQKLGAALVAGDITAGDAVVVYYDGTQFQMLTPARTPVLANGTGVDASIVTGTAGIDGNLATWNSDGDLVDGPDLLDEDDLSSDSDTDVATQQSIKAYIDAAIAAIPTGITLGTEQASTSGTAINFTSIPSGTKRITVQFVGVSTNGTSDIMVQIGDSGGLETSGYLGAFSHIVSTPVPTQFTTGFGVTSSNAASQLHHGTLTLTLEDSSNNTWVGTAVMARESAATGSGAGSKSLSATLDRLTITTVSGSDAFDAGAINIIYE